MRYIIFEEAKGIFLGNYLGVSIFSTDLEIPFAKSYGFESREKALDYIYYMEKTELSGNYRIGEVPCDDRHIPIDILIKSGYSKYTADMLKYLPVINQTVH